MGFNNSLYYERTEPDSQVVSPDVQELTDYINKSVQDLSFETDSFILSEADKVLLGLEPNEKYPTLDYLNANKSPEVLASEAELKAAMDAFTQAQLTEKLTPNISALQSGALLKEDEATSAGGLFLLNTNSNGSLSLFETLTEKSGNFITEHINAILLASVGLTALEISGLLAKIPTSTAELIVMVKEYILNALKSIIQKATEIFKKIKEAVSYVKTMFDSLKLQRDQFTKLASCDMSALAPAVPVIPTLDSVPDVCKPSFESICASMPSMPSLPSIDLPSFNLPSISLPALPAFPKIPSLEALARKAQEALPSLDDLPDIPDVPSVNELANKLCHPPVETASSNTLMPDNTGKNEMDKKGVNMKAQVAILGEDDRQKKVESFITELESALPNIAVLKAKFESLRTILMDLSNVSTHPTSEAGWKAKFEEFSTVSSNIVQDMNLFLNVSSNLFKQCINPNAQPGPTLIKTETLAHLSVESGYFKKLISLNETVNSDFNRMFFAYIDNNIKYSIQKVGYAQWELYGTETSVNTWCSSLYNTSTKIVDSAGPSGYPQFAFSADTFSYFSKILEVSLKVNIDRLKKSLPAKE